MLKVSVIIPVYRVPQEYLRVCLDSLTAQTMQECEFILVSDGAPEAECSICKEYADKDTRFKFFRREHAGVSATRNYGIDQAQGEYITFVDCDDWIDSASCQVVYDFAKKNDSDIVLWEACLNINGIQNSFFFRNDSTRMISTEEKKLLIKNIIHTTSTKYSSASMVSCKLFNRKFITQSKIYYPENLTISEDRIFNINAFLQTKKISYLHDCFYYYRIHGKSVSHKFIPDAFSRYTDFILLLDKKTYNRYLESVNNEIIRSFFLSWNAYYFHKEYKSSILDAITEVKSIAKKDSFKKVITESNVKSMPFVIRMEIFFIVHDIYFLIYLHGMKAFFKRITR